MEPCTLGTLQPGEGVGGCTGWGGGAGGAHLAAAEGRLVYSIARYTGMSVAERIKGLGEGLFAYCLSSYAAETCD